MRVNDDYPSWNAEKQISDPVSVRSFWKKLLELREAGEVKVGQTGAAYALHHAVKVLRDKVGEKNFSSWAPFVHFGV